MSREEYITLHNLIQKTADSMLNLYLFYLRKADTEENESEKNFLLKQADAYLEEYEGYASHANRIIRIIERMNKNVKCKEED